MKFVVPLTMPRTRATRFAARSSASGPSTGMPPATAASKRSGLSAPRDVRSRSGPWWAIRCLFAVTTARPLASAASTSVRAGSSPPMTSTITSTSGLATRCAGPSVTSASGMPQALARSTSRTATPARTSGEPSAGASRGDRSRNARTTSRPTVPAPSTPTRSGWRLIDGTGAATGIRGW